MAKSIGIHFFGLEDIFRCYRDNENLKQPFGCMDTLNIKFSIACGKRRHVYAWLPQVRIWSGRKKNSIIQGHGKVGILF